MLLYRTLWLSIPQRYVLTIMIFFAIIIINMMRNCLSMALTQMVVPNIVPDIDLIDKYTCPINEETMTQVNQTSTETEMMNTIRFAWSEELQGVILGSFYIGYIILHIPGGLIAERFGGKYIVVSAIFLTALLTLLTPITVVWCGATGLIVLRILMGLCQGGALPAITVLMSQWVPSRERGLLGSLIFSGIPVGAIACNFTSGLLLHYYQNWQQLFYYFGVLGIIGTILFILLCSSDPNSHRFITDKELNYLEKEIGQLERDKNLVTTPWKSILTSGPVLALTIVWALEDWAYFVLIIDLPKYINDVLHVSIQETGVYTSVPWAMRMLVSGISGCCSDWLISSGRISITTARKLFMILSSAIDGIFIILASYAGCDAMLVALYFTISVGAEGFLTSSMLVNPMDLSPNYSGTIIGMGNGVGSLMGIIVPSIIGVLTPNSLASEWRIVFWITFWIHFAKIVIFTIWGSGKVQFWNTPTETDKVDACEIDAEKEV